MRGIRRDRIIGHGALPDCRLSTGRLGEQQVVVAWAGAGAESAGRAAEAALERGVDALLAVGFAGALSTTLHVGDLLFATEIAEPGGDCWEVDESLLATFRATPARSAGRTLTFGRLVMATRVLADPSEKRRMEKETGAVAVDMESAAIARRAALAGVPMGALRAMTDGAAESLPPDLETCFDSAGQFHRTRLLRLLARRPTAVGGLLRLGRQASRAGRELAGFLVWHFSFAGTDSAASFVRR
jgi:adenosylhomocysteine nucleosidase